MVRDLQDPADAVPGELQTARHPGKVVPRLGRELQVAPYRFFGQLGVAGEAERGPAPLLDLPRPHYARADGGAGLGPAGEGEQLLRRQMRDGDLEVDAVEDGTGELAPVPVQLRGGADALLHGIAREPAGAGVGRQDTR